MVYTFQAHVLEDKLWSFLKADYIFGMDTNIMAHKTYCIGNDASKLKNKETGICGLKAWHACNKVQ